MKTKAQGRWIPGLTLLAPIAWGTTYLTITELAPQDRPLLVAMLRVLPAGLVLVLFAGLVNRWRPTGREWGHTALLSLFNFGLFFPLLITAIYRLPGGVAASVGGTQPLLVVAISALFGVSVLRVRELVIGFLAVLGVALVVVRPNASIDPIGVAAAVGANVSFSIGVVLTKKLPAPGNRMGSTGWQLLLSSAVLAPLAIAFEGRPPPLTVANVVGIAYLSLIATGLAFVIWFNGIRRLPTQSPPLLGLAAPIAGATLGWAVLAEQLSWVQIAGFVVTVSAIAYGATIGATAGRETLPADLASAGHRGHDHAHETAPADRGRDVTNELRSHIGRRANPTIVGATKRSQRATVLMVPMGDKSRVDAKKSTACRGPRLRTR